MPDQTIEAAFRQWANSPEWEIGELVAFEAGWRAALEAASPAPVDGAALAVLKRYEAWEARLITGGRWSDEMRLTDNLVDELVSIQADRNRVLRSAAPATGREALGRRVRGVWLSWAKEQPDAKPSWLLGWDDLDEGQREVDCRIGAALWGDGFAAGMDSIEAARAALAAASPAPVEEAVCKCGHAKRRHAIGGPNVGVGYCRDCDGYCEFGPAPVEGAALDREAYDTFMAWWRSPASEPWSKNLLFGDMEAVFMAGWAARGAAPVEDEEGRR